MALSCSLFGHRLRFAAADAVMRWECERCGGARGEKAYESPQLAARYAAALAVDPRGAAHRRPLVSALPLALLKGCGRPLKRVLARHNDRR
jgi:hypothetical protein